MKSLAMEDEGVSALEAEGLEGGALVAKLKESGLV
jgi:hypothetical protein